MKLIKVAAGVLNQTPLDWTGNRDNILAAITDARTRKASVLCLPEMCITGYGCEDMFHSPGLHRTAWQLRHDILPTTRGRLFSLALRLSFKTAVFNTACLGCDGKIFGFAAKRFLAGGGIHCEPRWFKPWPHDLRLSIHVIDAEY